MKVFIVNGYGYGTLFLTYGHEVVADIMEADLCVFTGGEDVTPSYYGEKKHPNTYNNQARDLVERSIFNICITREIPMVGICRGGQFLNVMSGGKMFQHVSLHAMDHYLVDVKTKKQVWVSSTHHQMMIPGPGGRVLAYATQGGYKEYMDGNAITRAEPGENDTEVVFYPLTKALCFQPHPEFMSKEYEDMRTLFFKYIADYLGKE